MQRTWPLTRETLGKVFTRGTTVVAGESIEDLGVRYIYRKVSEISEQVEDNYHVLRDIHDATTGENGHGWYDLYDDDHDL